MEYNEIKKTIRYRIYRFLWVKCRDLSNWSGKRCIAMLKKADIKN